MDLALQAEIAAVHSFLSLITLEASSAGARRTSDCLQCKNPSATAQRPSECIRRKSNTENTFRLQVPCTVTCTLADRTDKSMRRNRKPLCWLADECRGRIIDAARACEQLLVLWTGGMRGDSGGIRDACYSAPTEAWWTDQGIAFAYPHCVLKKGMNTRKRFREASIFNR
jgi:hypothetical protein